MTNTSLPLVAVVTPVFNGAEFLAETMETVQAQTYSNLVHVLLDNASADATPQIIDSFRNRRVPLITKRHQATVPMARNWNDAVGMVPAAARYFRLLCADDLLRPDAIARYVEVADRDPDIGLVGSLWRATGLCGEELPAGHEVFEGRDVLQTFLRREHSALAGTHALVRRSASESARPFYDEVVPSFDTEANLRICQYAKYGFVREELGTWRMHANSTTNRFAKHSFLHEMCWMTLLDRYGPDALGYRQYLAHRKAYRRHLLRRILKSYLAGRDIATFGTCMRRLREAGDEPGAIDFADALANWAYLAGTLRRHTVGRPSRREAFEYHSYKPKTPIGF